MIRNARLPPLFSLVCLGGKADIAADGCRAAVQGADPGTVLCADRSDVLDVAVILHPETPLTDAARVIYVATLGLGDAIGTSVPAGIDVTYRWPGIIEANLGAMATLGLLVPDPTRPDATPDWLVLRATAVVEALQEEWRVGVFPETSLHDEGGIEVTVGRLLESFARHFLTWMNRWEDDGFGPVRAMWLRHARTHGHEIEVACGGTTLRGVFGNIDDSGAIVLKVDNGERRIGLLRASGVVAGAPA